MTDRTQTPLAGLGLDTAIHLRRVLREVRGKRTPFMAANPDDLRVLAEMGLIEMQERVPTITSEGERALAASGNHGWTRYRSRSGVDDGRSAPAGK
jgi:hypothetical protein